MVGIPGVMLETVGLSVWVKKSLGLERPAFLVSVLCIHRRRYRRSGIHLSALLTLRGLEGTKSG